MSPKASSLALTIALTLVVGCDDSESPTQPATTQTTSSGGGKTVTPPVTPAQTDPVVVAHDTGEWSGASAAGTDLYVHLTDTPGGDKLLVPEVGDSGILVYSCTGDLTFLHYPAGTYKARVAGTCELVYVDNRGGKSTIPGSAAKEDKLYDVSSFSRGAWTWTWDTETFSMR